MFIKLSAGAKKNVKDFASRIKDSSALDMLTGQWLCIFCVATTLRITTFNIVALRITTLNILTLRITTLSIIGKMDH
jgi:hypothetical protein